MPLESIKPGDKLTFLWQPGYRGPLRDGETVIVLSLEGENIRVRYRLSLEEILQPVHLFRPTPAR